MIEIHIQVPAFTLVLPKEEWIRYRSFHTLSIFSKLGLEGDLLAFKLVEEFLWQKLSLPGRNWYFCFRNMKQSFSFKTIIKGRSLVVRTKYTKFPIFFFSNVIMVFSCIWKKIFHNMFYTVPIYAFKSFHVFQNF